MSLGDRAISTKAQPKASPSNYKLLRGSASPNPSLLCSWQPPSCVKSMQYLLPPIPTTAATITITTTNKNDNNSNTQQLRNLER